MSDAVECPRAGRWFGGCKWEGRYDTHFPNRPIRNVTVRALSRLKERTYVRDACVRCGKTMERKA